MARVSDHMSTEVLSIDASTTVVEAARRMAERGVGAVVVADASGLAGILTERDVMRAVAEGRPLTTAVEDLMTRHPETIEPDETMDQAAVLMIHGGFRHLPVVDRGSLLGILSLRDVVRVAVEDKAPRGV